MSSTSSNAFALLDTIADSQQPAPTTAAPAPVVASSSRRFAFGGKSWADMDDDDDVDIDNVFQFPKLGQDLTELKRQQDAERKEEEQAQKRAAQAFSKSLASKREIKIPHTRRLFTEDGKDNGIEVVHRTLRVVTKDHYENLLRLVGRHKTHDKNGRLNRQEQRSKIKLANSLLETTYKVPGENRFAYHVAIIHLSNGTDLTRGEVMKDSNAPFELEERFHQPSSA